MKAELEKFIEREAEKFCETSEPYVTHHFTAGANSLAPLLLEAVEALEWIERLDTNPFNHHRDASKCTICKAKETLASIRGKLNG